LGLRLPARDQGYRPEIKELDDHGHVRITYKMNIQDQPTQNKPEYLPYMMNAAGKCTQGHATRSAALCASASLFACCRHVLSGKVGDSCPPPPPPPLPEPTLPYLFLPAGNMVVTKIEGIK